MPIRAAERLGRVRSYVVLTCVLAVTACRRAPEADDEQGAGTKENAEPPMASPVRYTLKMSAGISHACSVTTRKSVACWGSNAFGQLGDGTRVGRTDPVEVPGVADVVQVSAGIWHSCAALSDGSVRCWGDNRSSQLGDGTFDPRLQPVSARAVAGAVAVEALGNYTCALLGSGGVRCWGGGKTEPFDLPTGESRARGLAGIAGEKTSNQLCVAFEDWVACGGLQRRELPHVLDGPIALSSHNLRRVLVRTAEDDVYAIAMPSIVHPVASGALDVAGACMLMQDHRVRCDPVYDHPLVEVDLPRPVDAIALSGPDSHCVADASGELVCWGSGGPGTDIDNRGPDAVVDIPLPSPAVSVSRKGSQVCAISSDDTTTCWRADFVTGSAGDLASLGGCALDPSGQVRCEGYRVRGLGRVASLGDNGDDRGCAALSDGSVRCWSWEGKPLPRDVREQRVSGVDGALEVALTGSSACARLSGGRVDCWDLDAPITPHRTMEIDASQLVAGGGRHCVLDQAGRVHCWGSERSLDCDDGAKIWREDPDPTVHVIDGLDPIARIETASSDICALEADGDLQCWGGSQLGHPACRDEDVWKPRKLGGFPGATDLAVGDGFVCVLEGGSSPGAVACIRAPTASAPERKRFVTAPRRIAALHDVRALVAGKHGPFCALDGSGEVHCADIRGGIVHAAFHDAPHLQGSRGLVGDERRVCGWAGTKLTCPRGVGSMDFIEPFEAGDATLPRPPTDDPVELDAGEEIVDAVHSHGSIVVLLASGDAARCSTWRGKHECQRMEIRRPLGAAPSRLVRTDEGFCAISAAGKAFCRDFAKEIGRTSKAPVPESWRGDSGAMCEARSGRLDCLLTFPPPWSEAVAWPTQRSTLELSDVRQVAFGKDHACILHDGGSVSCVGQGYAGQLGHGSTTPSDTPVLVQELDDVVALVGLGELPGTCAVRENGTVWCWGAIDGPEQSPRTLPAKWRDLLVHRER